MFNPAVFHQNCNKISLLFAASPGAAASEAMESSAKVEIKQESEEPGVKKKKKKRNITWAVDDKLVAYHYYEPDDEERVAVQHIINFHDAQHQEAIRERQVLCYVKAAFKKNPRKLSGKPRLENS